MDVAMPILPLAKREEAGEGPKAGRNEIVRKQAQGVQM